MAFTAINKSSAHFDCPTWTGSDSTTTINGMGFKPDVLWLQRYNGAGHPVLNNSSEGTGQNWIPSGNNANDTTVHVASYTSDGFTLTGNIANTNDASELYVGACWKSGGTSPTQTYVVKVVSDGGNKYRFDDFGTSTVAIQLQEGGVYTFDQADSSNDGHPFRFSTTSNGSHGGGSEYTTGVVVSGTPGNAGAKTVITVAASAPTLYYYCTAHSGMGGTANTNVTTGSSNFAGSILSVASVNTTAGISMLKFTGTGANGTIGHGLGVAPKLVITKSTATSDKGLVFNGGTTIYNDTETDYLQFATTGANADDANAWNDTKPTSSVISIGSQSLGNASSQACIAYAFAEIKGFSKMGFYIGNNNIRGPKIYCGFRPKWIMVKNWGATEDWFVKVSGLTGYGHGGKRERTLKYANSANSTNCTVNFESNGFRITTSDGKANGDGAKYMYFAFAEMPMVASNGIVSLAT